MQKGGDTIKAERTHKNGVFFFLSEIYTNWVLFSQFFLGVSYHYLFICISPIRGGFVSATPLEVGEGEEGGLGKRSRRRRKSGK